MNIIKLEIENFAKRISPEWSLRIGIGVMYLYSGFDLILHPKAWTWALPYWTKQMITALIPIETYLQIQGGVEILMALCLLAWFLNTHRLIKYVALLSTLEMAAILILAFLPWNPNNFLITFRDIGLLGGSLALTAMLFWKEAPKISNS